MNCEEFAMAGLDLHATSDHRLQDEARKHLLECPYCAALQEDWQALRGDLRDLGEETQEAEVPARVEMRLLQEFRIRHRTLRTRRIAWLAGWSIATAALVFGAASFLGWYHQNKITRSAPTIERESPVANPALELSEESLPSPAPSQNQSSKPNAQAALASNSASEFTLLPSTMPGSLEGAAVIRVRLQRGALRAFGLPVSEERATDWIQVDLLVSDDGQPQAVRLPPSTIN